MIGVYEQVPKRFLAKIEATEKAALWRLRLSEFELFIIFCNDKKRQEADVFLRFKPRVNSTRLSVNKSLSSPDPQNLSTGHPRPNHQC